MNNSMHKLDTLDEVDQLLKGRLPKLTQDETDILNSPVTTKEFEFVVKKTSRKRNVQVRWFHR